MLIDSEILKERLRVQADAEWDGAYDAAVKMVETLERETFERNVQALRDELERATAPCEDKIMHGGTVFTCREVGYHRIHDDHWYGTPMRWLDTSKGRLREQ